MEARRESHSCPRPGQAAGSLGTQGWEPAPLPDPVGLLIPQVTSKKAIRQDPCSLCLQGRKPRTTSEHPSLPPSAKSPLWCSWSHQVSFHPLLIALLLAFSFHHSSKINFVQVTNSSILLKTIINSHY